ncbi:MAG TPA: hypothetical protein VKY31_03850 [Terriglobia bacterium]|nr:hypothetical protein [Terriglobia bacterium]
MQSKLHRFPLIAGLTVALCVAVLAEQKAGKPASPPASPQAKPSQPATHFTQGTITSIQANQLVITKTVRGKAEQMTFALTSQTQRTGTLAAGTRVSVQYREADNQNIAAAVRELPATEAAKSGKITAKPKSKS